MSACAILDGLEPVRQNGKTLPCTVLAVENAKLLELEERIHELELRLDMLRYFTTATFELQARRLERIEKLLNHKGGDA